MIPRQICNDSYHLITVLLKQASMTKSKSAKLILRRSGLIFHSSLSHMETQYLQFLVEAPATGIFTLKIEIPDKFFKIPQTISVTQCLGQNCFCHAGKGSTKEFIEKCESGFTRKRRSTNPLVDESYSVSNSQNIFQPPSDHHRIPETIRGEDTWLSNPLTEEQEPNFSGFDTSDYDWSNPNVDSPRIARINHVRVQTRLEPDIDSGMVHINSLEVQQSNEYESDSGIQYEEIATSNSPSWSSSNIGFDSPRIARINHVRVQTSLEPDIDSGMVHINSLEVQQSNEYESDSGIQYEEIATDDSPRIARINSVRVQTRDYQPHSRIQSEQIATDDSPGGQDSLFERSPWRNIFGLPEVHNRSANKVLPQKFQIAIFTLGLTMSMIIGKSFDLFYFFSISTFYDMLVPSHYSTDTFLKLVLFFYIQFFLEDVFLLFCNSILAFDIFWLCYVLLTFGTKNFYPYFWTKYFPQGWMTKK